MLMNETLLKKTVETAEREGARNVIVKLINSVDYQIRFSNNAIDLNTQWNSNQMEIFLSIGRKITVLTVQNPSEENINSEVTKAVQSLRKFPRSLLYWGMDKNARKYSTIEGLYHIETKDLQEKAPGLVNATIQAAIEEGAKSIAGVLYFGSSATGVLTSYGNGGSYDGSYYRLTVRAFVDGESSGQDVIAGRDLARIEKKFTESGAKAGKLAKMALGGEQGKPGKYDVIISPIVGGNVFGYLIAGANPVYIIGRMSCLGKSMNKQIGPKNLTVSDNPLIAEGLNSRPFDFEGTPSQSTPLIKNGTLIGLIHNTSSAKIWKLLKLKFGTKSTGNSYLGGFMDEELGPKVLAPINSNIVYEPGDFSLDEMIAESKKPTIYITSNWYTRFTNNIEGKFSTIPRDGMFLIENGEIKKSLRNLRLTETLLGMCNRIQAIGKDIKQINWWEVLTPTFIPTIKIADCSITAATQ